jgi:hypothetical protein
LYSQILWTYPCVLYLIFLFSVNQGKGGIWCRGCGFENQKKSFFYTGRCKTSNMIVQSIHAGSGVNLFLRWMGTWNSFPGRTTAGTLNSTHFTWCQGSEWVKLLIYFTSCLYGVHRDNFLFAVPFKYISDIPRLLYQNGEKIRNFQFFLLSLHFTK